MGDPSFLRLVPASSATSPIDWTRIPEASKKYLLGCWGGWSEPDGQFPATINDLARMFHESKFFGYMRPETCTLLLDISEFGLPADADAIVEANDPVLPVRPRFYMKYLSQVWFVLFMPGQRDGIIGWSPDVPQGTTSDDEDEELEVAHDKVLAEEFDPRLSEEVRRWGTHGVLILNAVTGWESSTLKDTLERTQLSRAILWGLPSGHPVHKALVKDIMGW
jgi:hypothetical protein